jgi:hypothetical protein
MPRAVGARRFLERRKNLIAFDGKRRHEAGKKGAEKGQADGKSYNGGVDTNGFDAVHVLARCDEPLNSAIREDESRNAAGSGKQKTFGEVLAEETPAAATESCANG